MQKKQKRTPKGENKMGQVGLLITFLFVFLNGIIVGMSIAGSK